MEKPYGPKFYLVIAPMLGAIVLMVSCLIPWGELRGEYLQSEVVMLWVLGSVLSVALLVFWMVVAWRAMRAQERLARSGERAAAAIEEFTRSRTPGNPAA